MSNLHATSIAHPNIAFIKYWGNTDDKLRLPANGSLSMNMSGLATTTSIEFQDGLDQDQLLLNGIPIHNEQRDRVTEFLDHFRRIAGIETKAMVASKNNFPMGAGIASSSSAFAALAKATAKAMNLDLSESELSAMARMGSGSAARSIPTGFVEWKMGESHEESFAFSIAPPDHWELADLVAVINPEHKITGSGKGQRLAHTSPLQNSRITDAPRRLKLCRDAVVDKDFDKLTDVVEQDCNIMHAVMMTSDPPLFYWNANTLKLINAVRALRKEGIPAFYTIDAGPNVHIITLPDYLQQLKDTLEEMDFIQSILIATPGEGAATIESDNN